MAVILTSKVEYAYNINTTITIIYILSNFCTFFYILIEIDIVSEKINYQKICLNQNHRIRLDVDYVMWDYDTNSFTFFY